METLNGYKVLDYSQEDKIFDAMTESDCVYVRNEDGSMFEFKAQPNDGGYVVKMQNESYKGHDYSNFFGGGPSYECMDYEMCLNAGFHHAYHQLDLSVADIMNPHLKADFYSSIDGGLPPESRFGMNFLVADYFYGHKFGDREVEDHHRFVYAIRDYCQSNPEFVDGADQVRVTLVNGPDLLMEKVVDGKVVGEPVSAKEHAYDIPIAGANFQDACRIVTMQEREFCKNLDVMYEEYEKDMEFQDMPVAKDNAYSTGDRGDDGTSAPPAPTVKTLGE